MSRNNNVREVGEFKVTEEVLGLLVNLDLLNIELRVLRDNVVLSLTLFFLELEGDTTNGSPIDKYIQYLFLHHKYVNCFL